MRSIIGAAAALALSGAPSMAAEVVCKASAKGAAGEAEARLTVRDGAIVGGSSSWRARADRSSTPTAMLWISRPYADPIAGVVGPAQMIVTFQTAVARDLKHEHAFVAVSSNLTSAIGKEWRTFRDAAAEMKAGRGPPHPDAILAGTTPFLRSEPQAVALLDSLDSAQTVITSVTNQDGTVVISRGLFWLNDRAGADTLAKEAHAKALKAARRGRSGCTAAAAPA